MRLKQTKFCILNYMCSPDSKESYNCDLKRGGSLLLYINEQVGLFF